MRSFLLLFLWENPVALVVTLALVAVSAVYFVLRAFRDTPQEVLPQVCSCIPRVLHVIWRLVCIHIQGGGSVAVEEVTPIRRHSLNIYYGTQTGTAKVFAERLAVTAEARGIVVAVCDLKDCDPEDTLTQEVSRGAAS